jgi:hypothetical protein
VRARLVEFAWKAVILSAIWLGPTEIADLVFWEQPAEVTAKEILIAVGGSHLIIAAMMIENAIKLRKLDQ